MNMKTTNDNNMLPFSLRNKVTHRFVCSFCVFSFGNTRERFPFVEKNLNIYWYAY